MKDDEFKNYINNFYRINDKASDQKLNELEKKQIDIFFESIEFIENKMEEVSNYISTLDKLSDVIIGLDKSKDYTFNLEIKYRSEDFKIRNGIYDLPMKRSGSRFLDSELRDNYWFVQSFIFRLKKIIAALSSESLKKNKEDFISHLIYLGQSSVKDNEGLNKVNEFINFWNNKKLPATHRINKTKERLLEVGSLFKDLKNKLKESGIEITDFSSFDEKLINDITQSYEAINRLTDENRKPEYSLRKESGIQSFSDGKPISEEDIDNKKYFLWESICEAFFANFKKYGKSMTSSRIAKIIFKEEIYNTNKSKFNRIIFSTLHRYSENNLRRDATFFTKDIDKKRFGSFWKLADTFELEKSWSNIINNANTTKMADIRKEMHRKFMHNVSEYMSYRESDQLKSVDFNPKMEKDLKEVLLFDELTKWRSQKSNEMNVPAYIVFKDSVLKEIAKKQPKDIKEFSKIKGVGEKKVQQFYEDIAEIFKNN